MVRGAKRNDIVERGAERLVEIESCELFVDEFARSVGDVALPVAGETAHRDRRGWGCRHGVPFLADKVVNPARDGLRANHLVDAPVNGDAPPRATERSPAPRIAFGPGSLDCPASELGAAQRGDPFEARRKLEHLRRGVIAKALVAFQSELGRRELRIEDITHTSLSRLIETGSHATPRDPKLLPAARLGMREAHVEKTEEQGCAFRIASGARVTAISKRLRR